MTSADFVLPSTVAPPTLLLPRADVFAKRARRLRQLAPGHAMADWLHAVAQICDAQQQLASQPTPLLPTLPSLAPAQALGWLAQPGQRATLLAGLPALHAALLAQLAQTTQLAPTTQPAGAANMVAGASLADAELLTRAQRLLHYTQAQPDVAASGPQDRADLLLGASLQLLFTHAARQLALPPLSPLPGTQSCPCCGSAAHAGVVMISDGKAGLRYLECSLCATRWHAVRARCTLCDSPREVEYRGLEGAHPGVQAETCDACHGYVKTLFQDKDRHAEPLADDLATLMLDVLIGEAGYGRASPNLLLLAP